MKKNNIISDWLDKFGDPEIDKKVEMELEKINKERYNQIIDEGYKNYVSTHEDFEWTDDFCKKNLKDYGDQWDIFSKEEFINKCKTDNEFSERWGLKIEERKLGNVERQILLEQKGNVYRGVLVSKAKNYKSHKKIIESIKETCDEYNIPTKQITLEYNGTKIEVYE